MHIIIQFTDYHEISAENISHSLQGIAVDPTDVVNILFVIFAAQFCRDMLIYFCYHCKCCKILRKL